VSNNWYVVVVTARKACSDFVGGPGSHEGESSEMLSLAPDARCSAVKLLRLQNTAIAKDLSQLADNYVH
jgi:hypothetical protein